VFLHAFPKEEFLAHWKTCRDRWTIPGIVDSLLERFRSFLDGPLFRRLSVKPLSLLCVKIAGKTGQSDRLRFLSHVRTLELKFAPQNETKAIEHDYICSTIVAAAFYYAGADMKVTARSGWLALVSPLQVVMSHGYLRDLKT